MKIESKKVWTSTTLLAAIGGFSGLLCGFILISFVEWVEFFCLFPFFGAVSASRKGTTGTNNLPRTVESPSHDDDGKQGSEGSLEWTRDTGGRPVKSITNV